MADALDRVVRRSGAETLAALTGMAGADLITLLLQVSRSRAGQLASPDVLRRYRTDRFVAPAAVPFRQLRNAEDHLLSLLPQDFEVLTLAPVAPMGTHSVVAGVDQNRVVSTIRGTEVAADPTNALALEAAVRRKALLDVDSRSSECVRLATTQRVVRAQRFEGAASFAHFTLFGAVSAGRDGGNLTFEQTQVIEHLSLHVAAVPEAAEIRLTVLDPRFAVVAEAIHATFDGRSTVDVVDWPERPGGRGYYTGLCFKVFAAGVEAFELGDGGFVDWTQSLLGNRKERLLISGIGVDRLALSLAG